jgi:hypothetical protein
MFIFEGGRDAPHDIAAEVQFDGHIGVLVCFIYPGANHALHYVAASFYRLKYTEQTGRGARERETGRSSRGKK